MWQTTADTKFNLKIFQKNKPHQCTKTINPTVGIDKYPTPNKNKKFQTEGMMQIQSLLIHNFKGFGESNNQLNFKIPNGTPGSGLNIFIGENNCGKSTIFEALDYLKDGTRKESKELINKSTDKDEFFVEVTFSGKINETVENYSQQNKIDVFKGLIYDGILKARRTGSVLKTEEAQKKITKIELWDDKKGFENKTGIDAPFKKLYDNNFIWSDTNAESEAKFGSSTICGQLLKEIAETHTNSEEYKGFSQEFHKIFTNPESELRKSLAIIEERVNFNLLQQFGDAKIKFSFDEIGAETFFKSTKVLVDDGIEVVMSEKGHGLQRAVALALLRVYAENISKKDKDKDKNAKPFFLFIDEPEICLHPIAQSKLLNALIEISRNQQVFLTTHSPFLIKSNFLNNFGIFIFKKENNNNHCSAAEINGIFNRAPTWGEIVFKAYNLPNEDFHDELFGYLQEIIKAENITQVDDYLYSQGVPRDKLWQREATKWKEFPVENRTIQYFIRNKIHHPENKKMQAYEYTIDELKISIEKMIDTINALKLKTQPHSLAGIPASSHA